MIPVTWLTSVTNTTVFGLFGYLSLFASEISSGTTNRKANQVRPLERVQTHLIQETMPPVPFTQDACQWLIVQLGIANVGPMPAYTVNVPL